MDADDLQDSFGVKKFGTLPDFLRGYLHQDYQAEHGTPDKALDAYCREASVKDLRKLDAGLKHFLEATALLPFERVREILSAKFGSGWLPQTPEELTGLLVHLRKRIPHR